MAAIISEGSNMISNGAKGLRDWLKGPHTPDELNEKFIQLFLEGVPKEDWTLLLQNGADVNQIHPDNGETALVAAASHGQIDTVRILLDFGANVSKSNEKKEVALIPAAAKGYTDIVQLLLARHKADYKEEVAHIRAAMEGSDIVRYEETELSWTVRERSLAMVPMMQMPLVKMLLGSRGAASCAALIALINAAKGGHESIVKALLEHDKDLGADWWFTNLSEQVLSMKKAPASAKDAITVAEKFTIKAMTEAELFAFKVLVDYKPFDPLDLISDMSVNTLDLALAIAILGRHTGVIQELLVYNVVDKRLALFLAVRLGYKEIVTLLLKGGADVNLIHPSNDQTALATAANNGKLDIVQILLHGGAKLDGALPYAAEGGYTDIVQLMFDYNTNFSNIDGRTALLLAACEGHENTVELLLEHKVAGSPAEQIALINAAQNGHESTVTVLLGHGLDWGATWIVQDLIDGNELIIAKEKDSETETIMARTKEEMLAFKMLARCQSIKIIDLALVIAITGGQSRITLELLRYSDDEKRSRKLQERFMSLLESGAKDDGAAADGDNGEIVELPLDDVVNGDEWEDI